MKPNTILWLAVMSIHFCILHGDSVEYDTDTEGRHVAQCNVCGNKLVVVAPPAK